MPRANPQIGGAGCIDLRPSRPAPRFLRSLSPIFNHANPSPLNQPTTQDRASSHSFVLLGVDRFYFLPPPLPLRFSAPIIRAHGPLNFLPCPLTHRAHTGPFFSVYIFWLFLSYSFMTVYYRHDITCPIIPRNGRSDLARLICPLCYAVRELMIRYELWGTDVSFFPFQMDGFAPHVWGARYLFVLLIFLYLLCSLPSDTPIPTRELLHIPSQSIEDEFDIDIPYHESYVLCLVDFLTDSP